MKNSKSAQMGIITSAMIVALSMPASWAASVGFKPEIIGGINVKAGSAISSSTVLIVGESSDGEYICSGSLIADDMVVSAGHCVADLPSAAVDPANLYVIFSTAMPSSASDPSVHTVYGYEANPGWTGDTSGADAHDISVIRFKGAIPSGYAPATLLGAADSALKAGAAVTLAGYGITSASDSGGASAGTLRQVNVKIKAAYGQTEFVIDETKSKGACNGDSGGPAFLTVAGQLRLWGITSRGDSGCASEAIYTNIGAYLDWIDQAEADLRASN